MSSDHQPRTLLMAWKTSSGAWSTAKAAVKLAFPAVLAVMSELLAGWILGPANRIRCRARAAIGGALRHLRLSATYLAGNWPRLVRSGVRRRTGLRRPPRTGPAQGGCGRSS